jgi:hypothetical protein
MGVVLSKDAIMKCSHQFPVTIGLAPPPAKHKLTVGGVAIVGPADLLGATTTIACTAQTPDKKITAINAGAATKLTAGGAAVYLKDTFQALGVTAISVTSAGQEKLTAK